MMISCAPVDHPCSIAIAPCRAAALPRAELGGRRRIASRPGQYLRTPDADALAAIFERIAGEIPCPPDAYWGKR